MAKPKAAKFNFENTLEVPTVKKKVLPTEKDQERSLGRRSAKVLGYFTLSTVLSGTIITALPGFQTLEDGMVDLFNEGVEFFNEETPPVTHELPALVPND